MRVLVARRVALAATVAAVALPAVAHAKASRSPGPGCLRGQSAIAHHADGRSLVPQPARPPIPCGMHTGFAGGESASVIASRHGSGGRPVIRLDRQVERGTELAVARATLPSLGDDDSPAGQIHLPDTRLDEGQ